MRKCTSITDAAFVYLKGIHILDMSDCLNITDNAIVHLKGIHSLNIDGCPNITNTALEAHLQGIHFICLNDDEDDDVLNSILPETIVISNNNWNYEHFDSDITNIASYF